MPRDAPDDDPELDFPVGFLNRIGSAGTAIPDSAA